MLRHTEHTQIKRPVAPPIDLDNGRLDVMRAALAGGFVLGALLVASLGGWIVARSSGGIVLVFGLSLSFIGLVFGGTVLYVSVTEWLDHRARVQDWHTVAIEAYEQLGAAETMEKVSEWEFSTDNPAHVLIAALWVNLRIREGESLPYSVRRLNGPVFLATRRVGDIGKLTAEEMGRKFERLGLIEGRGERQAGRWVPQDDNEIVKLVLRNW